MEISKFEQVLSINVGGIFIRITCKPFRFIYRSCVFYRVMLRSMYFDYDLWDDSTDDMKDSQLFKLGLDVERINDINDYLNYNLSDRGEQSQRHINPPTWV